MEKTNESGHNSKFDGLLYKQKNCYEQMTDEQISACNSFAEG
jgi:hypothetical protein